jgi:hypothetical protein
MGSQRIPHIEILNGWEGYSELPGKQRSQCATYERELRLPIRRPAGKTREAVLAFKAKIDSWVKTSLFEKGSGARFLQSRTERCLGP